MEPRPLAVLLGELDYLRPRLVLRIGDRTMPLRRLKDIAQRQLTRGPADVRRDLLAPVWLWEDDSEGRTVLSYLTPQGPRVWATEAGGAS